MGKKGKWVRKGKGKGKIGRDKREDENNQKRKQRQETDRKDNEEMREWRYSVNTCISKMDRKG